MAEEITFTREDSDRLVRLEGLGAQQAKSLEELVQHIRIQNGRVSTLEEIQKKKNWFIAGVSGTVSFFITVLGIWFSK